jgi:hypothetical protein
VYVLNEHHGQAPCFHTVDFKNQTPNYNLNKAHHHYGDYALSNIATLANCKAWMRSKIRMEAADQWVIGVTPKRMGERRISYMMLVDHVIETREEYWNAYGDTRLDSIYRPNLQHEYFGLRLGYEQLLNPWHQDESILTDLGVSESVIVSRRFYIFAMPYHARSGKKNATGLTIVNPAHRAIFDVYGQNPYGYPVDVPQDFIRWAEKQPTVEKTFTVTDHFGGGQGAPLSTSNLRSYLQNKKPKVWALLAAKDAEVRARATQVPGSSSRTAITSVRGGNAVPPDKKRCRSRC